MLSDMNNNFPSKVSIIGAARSGLAAASFFVERGSKVFVSDNCTEQKLMASLETKGLSGLEHESGGHTDRVLDCEVLILSLRGTFQITDHKLAQKAGIPVV